MASGGSSIERPADVRSVAACDDQSSPKGGGHGVGTARAAHAPKELGQVYLDGGLVHAQTIRDLAVRPSIGQQLEHHPLRRCDVKHDVSLPGNSFSFRRLRAKNVAGILRKEDESDATRMHRTYRIAAVAGICAGCVSAATISTQPADDVRGRTGRPVIIGHRGATGYLPEHTLASYELAIVRGADFIEPDLVSTKDGVLIARHEVNITETTDVASHPEFAGRSTSKTIDGVTERGWFADDFTLAEIKTLRATQRLAFRPQEFNAFYQVPTFDEVIELAQSMSRRVGRTIGVYPETKHPTYHQRAGLALEPKLAGALERYGWNRRDAPVFIQSFEVANLKQLRMLGRVRLAQLIDGTATTLDGSIVPLKPFDFVVAGDPRTYADLLAPAGLAEIKTYADAVAPWKRYIVSVAGVDANHDGQPDDVNGDGVVDDADRNLLPPTSVVRDAHAAGLQVHTWTFRNERRYLGRQYGENPSKEYVQFFCLGVDAVFSDFPDTAVSARELLRLAPRALCP